MKCLHGTKSLDLDPDLDNFWYYTPFTRRKYDLDCDLDGNPEDVPDYTGNSLFNTTKHITLLFIVESLLHCYPPNNWIKII